MAIKVSKFEFQFNEFLGGQQSSGIVLIICTVLSLFLANSIFAEVYQQIWHTTIGVHVGSKEINFPLHLWINDGFMAIFFLFIGLEIKRELLVGELSNLRSALLPALVALGGMIFPALFYALINFGQPTLSGFGIPMATDIAFALGALSLLGNKVPLNLKVFLTALAVIDDLGAIIVIALFYGGHFDLVYFSAALGVFVVLLLLNKINVNSMFIYLMLGLVLWYFMLMSGVHATISGVLLALAVPFRKGDDQSISTKLEHQLHQPVNFIIMPIFALANTAITLSTNVFTQFNWFVCLGIFVGLLVGKVIGITASTFFAVKLGISKLPEGVKWKHVVGMGFLGGIGFTMSIFVSTLAFNDPLLIDLAKLVIIVTSAFAGVVGYLVLNHIESKQ